MTAFRFVVVADSHVRFPDDDVVTYPSNALLASAVGRKAIVNVELPRVGESTPFTDDEAVADWVEHAVVAASRRRTVSVFLDGFADHDRSYYPRHGLIDRRYNPRPALYRLIEASGKADPT